MKIGKKQNRVLLGLAVAALVAIFCYQVAYGELEHVNWIGGFNCFGENDCVNGWNNGTSLAETDWNSGIYTHNLNGGNFSCLPNFTQSECHGYIHGYIYEWGQLWLQEHNVTSSSNITRGGLVE
jgi:hypothetical protein